MDFAAFKFSFHCVLQDPSILDSLALLIAVTNPSLEYTVCGRTFCQFGDSFKNRNYYPNGITAVLSTPTFMVVPCLKRRNIIRRLENTIRRLESGDFLHAAAPRLLC